MELTNLTISGGMQFVLPSGGGGGIPTSGLTLLLDAGNTSSYSGTGSTWTDLSPSGKNGTIQSNVSWVSNGASSYFNFLGGADNYVTVPQFTALNSATTFSQSTWFQLGGGSLSTAGAWFSWSETGDFDSVTFLMGGSVNPYIEVGTPYTGTSIANPFNLGQWFNFTLTYDGSAGSTNDDRVKIYVDGVLKTLTNPAANSIPATLPNYSTNANIVIGGQAFNSEGKLIGNVAYSSVYNRALSSIEVTSIFDTLKGRYGF